MDKYDALANSIGKLRLLPVVVLENEADALPLADALIAGGLPVAEVTFRTAAAAQCIRAISANRPEMVIGAGTVLTEDQVVLAKDAGAQFLVSPGFNPKVVEMARKLDIPIVPGVNNPTVVEAALDAGLKTLKFFPAEASGGTAMLKSLAGPYPDVRFVPTGGVSKENLNEYLSLPNVLACGGSWMVDAKLVAAGEFQKITQLTREAVALATQK